MSKGDADVRLTSRCLVKMVEETLQRIKNRSEELQGCRLRVSGTPYLGTSFIERSHKSSLPQKEREKMRMMRIRPGVWRGEPGWILRCDVFNREIMRIAEEELSGLIGRVSGISFFISVH